MEHFLNEKQKVKSENLQLNQAVKSLNEALEILRKQIKTNEDSIRNMKPKGEESEKVTKLRTKLDSHMETSKIDKEAITKLQSEIEWYESSLKSHKEN